MGWNWGTGTREEHRVQGGSWSEVRARWAWRDAYLRLRYCNDFISLEKPLRVSIWLSRRCKVVRLLRFSKPSTFFNMFWA